MRILYGVNGEGLGHATRSRVVARHLINQGHEVKIAASGRAFPYLSQFFDDVEEIWGLEFALEHGQVDVWRTLTKNVRKGYRGVPEDWRRGVETAKSFGPQMVVTDFEAFSYLFAKRHRIPVISVGNIQMVDRCHHEPSVLAGYRQRVPGGPLLRRRQALARQPLHHHHLLLAAHAQAAHHAGAVTLARRGAGGRLPSRATTCSCTGVSVRSPMRRSSPRACRARVYGGRDDVTADQRDGNLLYRPFANEAFIEDLRTSRGVVASAGYSLMSEAVYLRKPMLALPLAGQFEQEMNARYLASLGYGTASAGLDTPALDRFLEQEPQLTENLTGYSQDGNEVAFATVDSAID